MENTEKHKHLENNNLSNNCKVESELNNLNSSSQIKFVNDDLLQDLTLDIWMKYSDRKRFVEGSEMLSFCFNIGTDKEWFYNIPIERLLEVLMKHKSEYMKDFEDFRRIQYASSDGDQSESVL